MPRITVHAVNSAGEPRRWTLSERIIAENLDSDHYINQLIERLAWATADAEAQESRSDDRRSGHVRPATAGAAELDARSEARYLVAPAELAKPDRAEPGHATGQPEIRGVPRLAR